MLGFALPLRSLECTRNSRNLVMKWQKNGSGEMATTTFIFFSSWHVTCQQTKTFHSTTEVLGIPPKFKIDPEKWWLEDDPFLLGRYLFSGYVKLWGVNLITFLFGPTKWAQKPFITSGLFHSICFGLKFHPI